MLLKRVRPTCPYHHLEDDRNVSLASYGNRCNIDFMRLKVECNYFSPYAGSLKIEVDGAIVSESVVILPRWLYATKKLTSHQRHNAIVVLMPPSTSGAT